MNKYPLWKNLLIIFIVGLGLIYASPNLYKPDPAIQISGASSSQKLGQPILKRASDVLQESGIEYFGEEASDSSILLRVHSAEQQLAAKAALESDLGGDYIVALNLAPTTPEWLRALNAGPMKLGLDLSGGVHFLLEVETKEIIEKRIQGYVEEIRRALREADLSSRGWKVSINDKTLIVNADNEGLRGEINNVLRKEFPNLERSYNDNGFDIQLSMPEQAIKELEDYAVSQNLTSLRNRVNELGVSEPLVQRQGRNRIVVELPGVQDTAQAKRIIGKTANLEFRLAAKPNALSSRKEQFAFRNDPRRKAYLEKKIIVTGDRVTNARASFDPETSLPQVNITLDGEGGKKMHLATRNNVGRQMGVLFIESKTETKKVINEQGEETTVRKRKTEKSLINMATVQSALGVQFRITGLDSVTEASELALLLRAGALAAPIDFVEERTVGPSLGAESIRVGVLSVQIGLALVMVFMLVYYRFFGLAANAALVVNLVLLVACMSILGATLTLPGIAGIVLTVGMAVDANVLIFSRIKEELKNGLSPHMAINAGYDRAFVTILDANITTLLVALILYAVGTGPIQGFAITLSLGIISSMFTAIMLTRSIVNFWYGGKNLKSLSI